MDRPRAYSIGTGIPPEQRDDTDELKTEAKEPTQILTTAIITGTTIRQEGKQQFTEYEILVTEDISSWIIKRRYKQFYKLNDYLKSTFGALVPKSFPPKQITTNKNQALSPHAIDRRHQILQNWLQLVLNNRVLAQDAKLRLFLTQDRVQVDFRPVVNRNRSRSDAKYQSANDYMGYLYHYKKGHWKKRWFILRQGLLYKYANPKDKHPYGWYDLKDAKAVSMSLQQVEQLKTVERRIKRRDSGRKSPESLSPSLNNDRRVNFKVKTAETTDKLTLTPDTDGPLSEPLSPTKKGARSPSIERRGSFSKDRGDYGFSIECEQYPKMIFTAESENERVCWLAAFNKPAEIQATGSPGTMSPRPRASSSHDVMTNSRDSYSSSIFGVPLDQIDEIDIDGVPVFISTILDYIEATALHKEDLFTYSPDANVKKLIENQGDLDLTVIDSPHAVAGLVIEWLVDLPTPIVPDDFYDTFFGAFKIEAIQARHAVVNTIISQLPEINRCLLFKLFRFLHVASARKPLQKERVVKLFGRLIFRPLPDHDKNGSVYRLTSELIDYYTLIEPPTTPRDPRIERTDSFYTGLISKLKTLDQGSQGNMIVEHAEEGSNEEVTIVTQVSSNDRERFITIQHKKSPRGEGPVTAVNSMPKITVKSSPTMKSPLELDEPFDDVSSSAEEASIRQVADKQLFDAIFGFESDEGSDFESDEAPKERLSNSLH